MTDKHMQYIALALIFGASIGIAIGEMHNWIHLVDFCNMFGGGGVGILTGQKVSAAFNNKAGGTMNLGDTASQPPQ